MKKYTLNVFIALITKSERTKWNEQRTLYEEMYSFQLI